MPTLNVTKVKSGEGLSGKLGRFEQGVLKKQATTVATVSPVDTAAYILSHSFSGEPGISSVGRVGGQDSGPFKQQAELKLHSQVANHKAGTGETLSNSAPHAREVENRSVRKAPSGYKVYAQVRREFIRHARETLQEVNQQ